MSGVQVDSLVVSRFSSEQLEYRVPNSRKSTRPERNSDYSRKDITTPRGFGNEWIEYAITMKYGKKGQVVDYRLKSPSAGLYTLLQLLLVFGYTFYYSRT